MTKDTKIYAETKPPEKRELDRSSAIERSPVSSQTISSYRIKASDWYGDFDIHNTREHED